METLIDDLWGETPPPSAAHTLETYVSRLRGTLEPHGPRVVRRGRGYVLELGGAAVDAQRFERLVDEAASAVSAGDQLWAGELAAKALACWRGTPLVDTTLGPAARAHVGALEELRTRALELRIDADINAGRHRDLIGELRTLVEANPYRERFVAQLMLVLYRSGRQAEALDTYERTRQRIDADLGLRPSRDLQALSAEIVRHDDRLSAQAPEFKPPTSARRIAAAAIGVTTAVVLGGLVFVATHGRGAHKQAAPAHGGRVALIVPRLPHAGQEDLFVTPFVDGLRLAARQYGLQTEILLGDDFHRRSPMQKRLAGHIRRGRFDLVIVASQPSGGEPLDAAAIAMPRTHFVFIDAYPVAGWRLPGRRNVTLVRLADEQSGYLAGYLSGLVERSRAPRPNRKPVVSVVGGMRIPQVTRQVDAFARGVRRAAPGVTVSTAYSGDFVDRERCAQLATRQIDAGSDIVFAAAGTCGLGALSVAGLRGVWGVGADQDLSYLGAYILSSTVKRFDRAVLLSVRWFVEGTLPRGRDIVLGLDDDVVGLAGISPVVASSVRERLARETASLSKQGNTPTP